MSINRISNGKDKKRAIDPRCVSAKNCTVQGLHEDFLTPQRWYKTIFGTKFLELIYFRPPKAQYFIKFLEGCLGERYIVVVRLYCTLPDIQCKKRTVKWCTNDIRFPR